MIPTSTSFLRLGLVDSSSNTSKSCNPSLNPRLPSSCDKSARPSTNCTPTKSSIVISNPKISLFMMYFRSYVEYCEVVRFRLVCSPRQKAQNDVLRNAPLRLPLNSEREGLRREDRHLVVGSDDVRDADWREPVQDHKGRGADKDSEGRGDNSQLRVVVEGGGELFGLVLAEGPEKEGEH